LLEVIPNVANMAHGAGLLAGVAIGLGPVAWRAMVAATTRGKDP
jgi:hypothetical protein